MQSCTALLLLELVNTSINRSDADSVFIEHCSMYSLPHNKVLRSTRQRDGCRTQTSKFMFLHLPYNPLTATTQRHNNSDAEHSNHTRNNMGNLGVGSRMQASGGSYGYSESAPTGMQSQDAPYHGAPFSCKILNSQHHQSGLAIAGRSLVCTGSSW